MDLKKYNLTERADNGATLDLVDPITGETLEGVTFMLLGTDSAAYREHTRGIQRARIAKLAKSRSKSLDLSVSEREEAETLAVCTIGWEGIKYGEVELEYSHDAAVQLYLNHPWIKDQVDAFIGDRANFLAQP